MTVLGIESTAHTLSIGISKQGRILSNVIDMYSGGSEGLIPRKLADHHSNVFSSVLLEALTGAKLSMNDIDLIAFSQGPGIGAPLSVGVSAAKYLALVYGKKIIGVNHPYAHVKIGEHCCKMRDPLVLYLSGGNTQILEQMANGHYIVLGETLDIGIGNLFDTFARAIKMENAHGSALAKLAENGNYIPLPYTVKGMNLVFSGLLTSAEKAAKKHSHLDVACSLMENAFAMTCEVTERALFLTKKKSLLVCGGVAQNRRLQEMLKIMCKEDNVKFGVAPDEYNRDNGAMIAYAGELLYKKYGAMKIEKCDPITNYRIDRMKEILR
ncbi:tRNA (adenosine(37)-N6)-threonylcarbamoyltransferase complex transferase subunit TsaD [Candidatus Micrarchaeota archaeon]|nr:tRNA (adenosine(37)-N6)-threonylcarbamoyltransferase complex transferase subunit TsaD [Candidatus Micrarchaeota archaeon]MBU1165817.1 tRNA (adenosine(37)-N6)-threonylcarbamoyltransferase complex transferase subunit TsaD [Candidatus Micrarchaeota archaeon]MBU1886821.1 tRNA (adenosine(37)-N6)-threonylcarbamoyltransferase complex transferase subunit TsaD [Candidatus Micrarchaeota archaeon]